MDVPHISRISQIGVFILAPHPIDESIGNVLSGAITGKGDDNMFQGGARFSKVTLEDALNIKFFPKMTPIV